MSDRDMLGDEVAGIDPTSTVGVADIITSLQTDLATLQQQRRSDIDTFSKRFLDQTKRIDELAARIAKLERQLGERVETA